MYYFYFTKGLKTGYVMEDENKQRVYEAKMEKLTFLKPYKYMFTNIKTQKSVVYEIGHRVTKSNGFNTGEHSQIRIVTDSHININGENNWEYLKKLGCSYEMNMDGLKPSYTLYKNDKKIAEVKTTGSDVYKEDGLMSKLPVNGNYRVECNKDDIETVFMFCFMMARAAVIMGD